MIITEKQQKYQLCKSGKIDKYEYLTSEEILPSTQRQIIEKKTKTIEEQGRKQIDAITNQNKRLADLTNKDYHKDIYKYLEN